MKNIKKLISIIIIVSLLCIFNINVLAEDEYPNWYRVTSSTLNVRFGPGTEYDSFFKLTYGEEVPGGESENGWTVVNCYGFKGYVYSSYIQNKNKVQTYSQSNVGNLTYLGRYYGTGYDICAKCCGNSNGITASGRRATVGRTVAMSVIAFGTQVYIKGIGYRVVEDRGVGPGCIDILVNNHSEAYAITGYYDVYLVN